MNAKPYEIDNSGISSVGKSGKRTMRLSKRDRLALLSEILGFTRFIESIPKRPCLIVLNYHRIGDDRKTLFDTGVFSANVDKLYRELSYLKRNFCVGTLDEALAFVEGKAGGSRHALVIITFDDGYIDNYELAFPVLQSLGLQGIFFLPTEYIGTKRIPWWDLIAYLIKNTHKKRLHLYYPYHTTLYISKDTSHIINYIIRIFTSYMTTDPQLFISHLINECEIPISSIESRRLFMNWDEVRVMVDCGMAIGSHTNSHNILSKQPFVDQIRELRISRRILEERLGTKIDVLAYPVGGKDTFTQETFSALHETGYRAAFSFYGGVNHLGKIMRFNILRIGVENSITSRRLRLQLGLAGAMGVWWA